MVAWYGIFYTHGMGGGCARHIIQEYCLYASEVAAFIGMNQYKSVDEVYVCLWQRTFPKMCRACREQAEAAAGKTLRSVQAQATSARTGSSRCVSGIVPRGRRRLRAHERPILDMGHSRDTYQSTLTYIVDYTLTPENSRQYHIVTPILCYI